MRLSGNKATVDVSWDNSRSVIDQITDSSQRASDICEAVALCANSAKRTFYELSDGEKHLAEIAKRLGDAESLGAIDPVVIDEFTSILDRHLAERVCSQIASFVRQSSTLRIVVATVHEDIAGWLNADWMLETKTGVFSVSSCEKSESNSPLSSERQTLRPISSKPQGDDSQQVEELLRPPVLRLVVRHLRTIENSKSIFKQKFEEHHYMKGKLPGLFHGVVAKDEETDRCVAFHAVSNFPGKGNGGITMLESRLVTLPEFQGFGIGPKMSEGIGELLLSAGKRLFSVTHHPRLGEQRNASDLWRGTANNGKAAKSLNGTKSDRIAFRHQFMGKCKHGNDDLAKAASAKSVGLLSRPGVLRRTKSGKTSHKILERLQSWEGKTVRNVMDSAGKDSAKVRRDIEACIQRGVLEVAEKYVGNVAPATPQKRSAAEMFSHTCGEPSPQKRMCLHK
jgi:energy-coupling factor transporter ATP-binding protein EcfA2